MRKNPISNEEFFGYGLFGVVVVALGYVWYRSSQAASSYATQANLWQQAAGGSSPQTAQQNVQQATGAYSSQAACQLSNPGMSCYQWPDGSWDTQPNY